MMVESHTTYFFLGQVRNGHVNAFFGTVLSTAKE
jgi:hypothetical protein